MFYKQLVCRLVRHWVLFTLCRSVWPFIFETVFFIALAVYPVWEAVDCGQGTVRSSGGVRGVVDGSKLLLELPLSVAVFAVRGRSFGLFVSVDWFIRFLVDGDVVCRFF